MNVVCWINTLECRSSLRGGIDDTENVYYFLRFILVGVLCMILEYGDKKVECLGVDSEVGISVQRLFYSQKKS